MDKVIGSTEALSSMQITADTEGLDAESKALLQSKEVLAVILQGTVEEYKGYSREEIMEFIEADYDLLSLVLIRLGDKVYNGEKDSEGYGLLRFLNAIMYPHREDFMDTVSEYIDFSRNEELWKETNHMSGLGQSILEEGREEGIRAFILDYQEEQFPRERILDKLQKRFKMSQEKAEYYYAKYAGEV